MLTKHFDNNGTAAVEFALVMPVLLFVLLGIMQYGYAFFVQISMTNAAREGARALAVGSADVGGVGSCASATAGSAEANVCDYLAGLSVTNFTIAACDPDNPDATLCPGDDDVAVRVTISRTEIDLTSLINIFDPAGTMVAQVSMRQED